jgi:hypothetical protein
MNPTRHALCHPCHKTINGEGRTLQATRAARQVGFIGFRFYPRSVFIHVDIGPARKWGQWFPVREAPFAADSPPAREVLAASRTMKGGGAAGWCMCPNAPPGPGTRGPIRSFRR